MSFWTIFRKFENQQQAFGKLVWANFVKMKFSQNCQQILGEFSEYLRFCRVINSLLSALLVLQREILSPQFCTLYERA